jgi:hypothetical protein
MKNENQVTKAITSSELVEILQNLDKPTFANVVSETFVKMAKTNNPYFELIIKHTKQNLLLCADYESRVNNNLVKENKENDFVSDINKVGSHVSKCVLWNQKTEKFYLQYERFLEIKPQVFYTFNGVEIDKEKFLQFMPKNYQANTQSELDKKVIFQTFKIESIKEISLNKIKYIVS